MEIKRISEYTALGMSRENFHHNTTIDPIENKDTILEYLKRFEDWAFTSQPVYDIYTGEEVADADNGKTDGVYTWYESEIYHFQKYNLILNDDFIKYVMNRYLKPEK